ncbi:MAG TPA: DUF971 domain-containing protein [Planctomycetaceae bacterium]|nr:DUF971 domain-containing protein [Planctomycetaceae bacterium]
MQPTPTDIQRFEPRSIKIRWSDGCETSLTAAALRKACPCATCREKKKGEVTQATPTMLPVLKAEEARPVDIQSMRPVGNYAYNIAFTDGHDSGIYTFEYLRGFAD